MLSGLPTLPRHPPHRLFCSAPSPSSLTGFVLCCAYLPPLALFSHRLKADDPFQVNGVFTAVWNCMGLYPLIWASILVPGGRGESKVCAC